MDHSIAGSMRGTQGYKNSLTSCLSLYSSANDVIYSWKKNQQKTLITKPLACLDEPNDAICINNS